MRDVLLLVFLFFIAPALLGQIRHIRSHPQKVGWYYRRYLIAKDWSQLKYSMLLFSLCAAALYCTAFLKTNGVAVEPKILLSLATLTVLAALWYLYCYFEKPIKAVKNTLPWKSLLGLATVGIAALSKIISDQTIAELTGLPAHDLPGAQLLLTLYFTPTVWLTVLSFLLSISVMISLGFVQLYSMGRDYLSLKKKQKYDSKPDLVAMAAMFLGGILSLTLTMKLIDRKTYETPAREAIVFASFHLAPAYCAAPDIPGAVVTPLQDDLGAMAIPDATLGYRFALISCKPQPKSPVEVEAMLKQSIPRAAD